MITIHIPIKLQYVIYATISISLITGLTFFTLNNWFEIEGDFGIQKHPWQFPILQIHGASAFIIMLIYGALLSTHVQFGWRSKLSRKSGLALLSIIACQIITAYMLYYLDLTSNRKIIIYAHLFAGISIPLLLFIHIVIAKKQKK